MSIDDAIAAGLVPWIICGVVVLIGLAKFWPGIRRLVRLVDTLDGLPETLDTIRHELTTNSGSSLKDAVKRTEAATNRNTDEIAEQRKDIGGLRSDVRALARRIDDPSKTD